MVSSEVPTSDLICAKLALAHSNKNVLILETIKYLIHMLFHRETDLRLYEYFNYMVITGSKNSF